MSNILKFNGISIALLLFCVSFNEPFYLLDERQKQKLLPLGRSFGEDDGARTHGPQNHNLML